MNEEEDHQYLNSFLQTSQYRHIVLDKYMDGHIQQVGCCPDKRELPYDIYSPNYLIQHSNTTTTSIDNDIRDSLDLTNYLYLFLHTTIAILSS